MNWHEAKAYCVWLSKKDGLEGGLQYRLMTEVEHNRYLPQSNCNALDLSTIELMWPIFPNRTFCGAKAKGFLYWTFFTYQFEVQNAHMRSFYFNMVMLVAVKDF